MNYVKFKIQVSIAQISYLVPKLTIVLHGLISDYSEIKAIIYVLVKKLIEYKIHFYWSFKFSNNLFIGGSIFMDTGPKFIKKKVQYFCCGN